MVFGYLWLLVEKSSQNIWIGSLWWFIFGVMKQSVKIEKRILERIKAHCSSQSPTITVTAYIHSALTTALKKDEEKDLAKDRIS